MKDKVQLILQAKENRYLLQQKLFNKYQLPMVTINLNIPGMNKTLKIYHKLFKRIKKDFCYFLKKNKYLVLKEIIVKDDAGYYLILLLVSDCSIVQLKKYLVNCETNNEILSLIDIDIFDKNNQKISRTDINFKFKSCYLCNQPAKICVKLKKHSSEELINYVNLKITDYLKLKKQKNLFIL